MFFFYRKGERFVLALLLWCLLFLVVGCNTNPGSLGNHLSTTSMPRLVPHLTEFDLAGFTGLEPTNITMGPDGALWFTDFSSHGGPGQIGRITPAGHVTEFSLSPIVSPQGNKIGNTPFDIITANHLLWFTEIAGKVGLLLPKGQFTGVVEVPLPSTEVAAGITAGPDNTLWFAEVEGDKIGRISSDGQITTFDLPTSSAKAMPFGITMGPDDALWFTESTGNKIGRIPANAQSNRDITEYPGLTPGAELLSITTGPDQNLWFTEAFPNHNGPDKIGRINPKTHVIEEFPLAPGVLPAKIITGPHHELWFTEQTGGSKRVGAIGVIQTGPQVKITEFDLSTLTNTTNPGPQGIAVGPQGTLWFTERFGDKIGRITFENA